jgi:hypothetical protein
MRELSETRGHDEGARPSHYETLCGHSFQWCSRSQSGNPHRSDKMPGRNVGQCMLRRGRSPKNLSTLDCRSWCQSDRHIPRQTRRSRMPPLPPMTPASCAVKVRSHKGP